MKRTIKAIERSLSPDLLNAMWRKLVKPGDHPTAGHCYVAAEALWHAWGRERGYKPMVIPLGRGQTHWFLKHPATGRIADPSLGQYDGETPPYSKALWCGFLTGYKPSKRCRVVLERMGL
jgi:hypothetical protein